MQAVDGLVGARERFALSCGILSLGIAMGEPYFAKEAEHLALPDGHVGTHEHCAQVVVFQIVEVAQTDVEVFAQIKVKLAQVEEIALVAETGTHGNVVCHKIAEIRAG